MSSVLAVMLAAAVLSAGPLQAQQSHLLVVTGLAGEPAIARQFDEWAGRLVGAATARHGVPAANVAYLSGDPQAARGRTAPAATRENLEKAVAEIAARSQPGDAVLIVLIGHGGTQGEPRLSLPGPDLTAAGFDLLLDRLAGRRVALVNAASASGGFIDALSARGRAVITATRSGQEGNQTVFGRFFAEAYAAEGADADKDGRTSLLEAFTYAAREVGRWYREQNRLVTEHALLDDDGDGKGSPQPDGRAGDGQLARSFVLGGGPPAAAAADPALRALYAEKRQIEERLDALRARKDDMEAQRYEAELEALLVRLAGTDQRIRQAERKP